MEMMQAAVFAADGTVALVFAAAAYNKARSFRNALLDIRSYRIIPDRLSLPAGILLIAAEIGIASAYCMNAGSNAKAFAAIIVLLLFNLALWYKRRHSRTNSCHCFGNAAWLNRFPMRRNYVLIVLIAIGSWLPDRQHGGDLTFYLFVTVAAVVLLADGIRTAGQVKEYRAHDGRLDS